MASERSKRAREVGRQARKLVADIEAMPKKRRVEHEKARGTQRIIAIVGEYEGESDEYLGESLLDAETYVRRKRERADSEYLRRKYPELYKIPGRGGG